MTAGISLERTDKEHAGIPAITFNTQEGLPQEGYKLSVTPANITITASQPKVSFRVEPISISLGNFLISILHP